MEKNRLIAGMLIIVVLSGAVFVYLSWFKVQESQATLKAYPITLNPDGSGTSPIMEQVDRTLIENATHLTEQDLHQYPALAEVLTGQRADDRGFAKQGGIAPGDEHLFAKKYYISEYNGQYYILLVQQH